MFRIKIIVTWILIIAFSLSGCATMQTGSNEGSSPTACIIAHTAGGALLGGVAGAIIGGRRGAITGALIGGSAGFAYAWGKCFASFSTVKSQQIKDYDETAREIGYSPQDGITAKITEYSLDPSVVNPGVTVKFNANYYVMAPLEQKDISVTETRILKKYDEKKMQFIELGKVEETITVAPGSRKADGKIDIYEKVEEGKYMIAFMVTSGGKTDIAEMPLTITKDKAVLEKFRQETSGNVSANIARSQEGRPDTPVTKETSNGGTTLTTASIKEIPSSADGEKTIQPVQEKTLEIFALKVNLRENPDTKSKIIATAVKGEKYPLIETKTIKGEKWYQIRLDDGKTPWLIGTAAKVLGE